MTGRWADEYPDQAGSIGQDPLFEVANHTYGHRAFAAPCHGLPRAASVRAEVARAFAAVRRAGVPAPVPYVRLPGGCFDEAALRALAPAKVTAVQADVPGGDAFTVSADAVAEEVLSRVRPGSVVSLHCTLSTAPATEEAVRRIVPELRARGYRLVRVSQLVHAGRADGAGEGDGTGGDGRAGATGGTGGARASQPEQAGR
jgi:peptidoglycan/xylan/chitin deacetylase (PgdA/CDA1 family)